MSSAASLPKFFFNNRWQHDVARYWLHYTQWSIGLTCLVALAMLSARTWVWVSLMTCEVYLLQEGFSTHQPNPNASTMGLNNLAWNLLGTDIKQQANIMWMWYLMLGLWTSWLAFLSLRLIFPKISPSIV